MERYCNMCRRLANPERVNLLRTVMTILEPGGLPVHHLAELAGMKVSATCQYLAQLESECGFVESVRQGRYVLYRTATQFDSDMTDRIVAALSDRFRREEDGLFVWRKSARPTPAFVTVMPALENESRLRVLAAIQAAGPHTKNGLVHRLGMSDINVRRHLKVLESCGLVARNNAQVEYRAPEDQLAQLFVQEALRIFSEQNKSLAPSQFTNVDVGGKGGGDSSTSTLNIN